jgi:hypothetical protein
MGENGEEQTFYISDAKAIHMLAVATQANLSIQHSFLELDHKRKTLSEQAELILKNPYLDDTMKSQQYATIIGQLQELAAVAVTLPPELRITAEDLVHHVATHGPVAPSAMPNGRGSIPGSNSAASSNSSSSVLVGLNQQQHV